MNQPPPQLANPGEASHVSRKGDSCGQGKSLGNGFALPSEGGELGTRPGRSSALPSANRVRCVPALISPIGGSHLLFAAISERRPDTQIALSVRARAAQAVAKCLSLLAGFELGEDPASLTVDDDEWLQGAHIMATDPTVRAALPSAENS